MIEVRAWGNHLVIRVSDGRGRAIQTHLSPAQVLDLAAHLLAHLRMESRPRPAPALSAAPPAGESRWECIEIGDES